MHVHAVGRCDGPDFASAGPHWNPTGAQHGRDNPMGAHHGDLPNLVVEAGEIGRATLRLVGSRFEGDGALLDADGAAFEAWGGKGLPTSVLIDRSGAIRYLGLGPLEWDGADAVTPVEGLLDEGK